jgi:hypothetical protein
MVKRDTKRKKTPAMAKTTPRIQFIKPSMSPISFTPLKKSSALVFLFSL